MGTNNKDTDPSSPGALRPRTPHIEALASTKPTTDPGLGPPSVSTAAPARRSPVSVPPPSMRHAHGPNAITPPDLTPIAPPASATSSSMPSSIKDSVELLLEGMAGPRPDRRKTKPQSDGEASAVYHAEHGLRRARNSSEPGPKVVVERAPPVTSTTERTPIVPRASAPGSREALSTFVPGRVLRRRVAVALVAAVLIVLLSFVGLRLSAHHDEPAAGSSTDQPVGATNAQEPSGATSTVQGASAATNARAAPAPGALTATPPIAEGEPGSSAAPAGAQPPKTGVAAAGAAPEASKVDAARTAASAHGATSGPTTRHHSSGAAAGDAPGDLGEFKPKF